MSTTITETEEERIVREEQEAHDRDQREERERRAAGDGDQTKLVELPKIKIVVDEADPTILRLHFSGDITIDRGDARWIEWWNRIRPGKTLDLNVGLFCPSAPLVHRRDKEGDVDAVAQTKNLIVTDVYLDEELEPES